MNSPLAPQLSAWPKTIASMIRRRLASAHIRHATPEEAPSVSHLRGRNTHTGRGCLGRIRGNGGLSGHANCPHITATSRSRMALPRSSSSRTSTTAIRTSWPSLQRHTGHGNSHIGCCTLQDYPVLTISHTRNTVRVRHQIHYAGGWHVVGRRSDRG